MHVSRSLILSVALLFGAILLPASPVSAESTHVDCRLLGGGGGPSRGVFRLGCPSATVECVDDENGSVCRVGAGAVSVVGGDFCWRPAGPLQPDVQAACASALDAGADGIAGTGCSDTMPVGDERIVPGVFVRVRDHDAGLTIIGFAVSCGARTGTCDIKVHDDLRPDPDCDAP